MKHSTLRRYEVSTFGTDEALQGFSSDPLGTRPATGPGLRVPPVLPGDAGVDGRPRYLFCLATRTISEGYTRIRGLRQGVMIGLNAGGEGIYYPIQQMVVTPNWRFIDGNISWHLVKERQTQNVVSQPAGNGPNWRKVESDDSAMLYSTFTNSSVTSTGSPVQYNVNLTSYTPPLVGQTRNWQPIADLGNFKDIRFPWQGRGDISNNIDEVVEGTWRISLYASVLQSNPSTRATPTYPSVSSVYPGGMPPEEAFLATFPNAIYWSVFGSILFEDPEYKVGGGP